LASHTQDDGFHEIQLNGKQLVFLGMATTIVSVVIFLCGVLVGRGVSPLEPVAEAATASAADTPAPAPEPAPAAAATPVPEPAATEPAPPPRPEPEPPAAAPTVATSAPAPKPAAPPAQDPTYYDKLAKATSKPAAAAKPPVEPRAAEPRAAEPRPAEPRSAEPKPAAPAVAKAAEPGHAVPNATPPVAEPVAKPLPAPAPATGGGAIAVQVAALSSRTDAEVIARRLSGKGYAAYVLAPEAGAREIYKVRVGNYASADEAERVSRRLAQEEKLKPWVIR
jgi:cell division septation protein DedD